MMAAPMRAREVLAAQLDGSCALIAEHAEAAAGRWVERPVADTSMPGFVLWHCARIVDWGVNAVVRRRSELAASDQWRERVRFDLGHGPGLTRAEADEAALTVPAGTVIAYARALRAQTAAWIADVADEDMDQLVDMRAACSVHPRYLTDAAWAEVENLDGVRAGQFLARPCVSHIRVHIGEVETLLTVLRSESPSG